jgi:ParB family chromosome partitioning protein
MALPPRSRLGRGLGSLLSMTDTSAAAQEPASSAAAPSPAATAEPAAPPVDRLTSVAVDKVQTNPHQPRKEFDAAAIDSLADSIKANGVIQPIVVRPLADGRFELIAGERRLRAARQAKLAEIPVVIRNIDGYTQAQWALVENIHREDLNPIDRAEAYGTLMQQLGLTQAELAGRLGEQRSSIANYLRILELAPTVREELRAGRLTLGHAKVLAGIDSHDEQARLAALAVEQHLSVRNLERLVENPPVAADRPVPAEPKPAALHLKEVEQQIVQQLGLRVQLRGGSKAGTGRMVIHYANLEQFDELMKRCGIQIESA